MWSYIMAAARGDRRLAQPSSAVRRHASSNGDINSSGPGGRTRTPRGGSGLPSRDYIRTPRNGHSGTTTYTGLFSNRLPRNTTHSISRTTTTELSGNTTTTTQPPTPTVATVEAAARAAVVDDLIVIPEVRIETETAIPEEPTRRSRISNAYQSATRWLGCKPGRKGRSRPNDWFLDKFSVGQQGTRDAQGEDEEDDSWCFGSRLAVDPTLQSHYNWLMLVSLAVLYNVVFVIGRSVFWEINNVVPALWWTLDYLCDAIYILDVGVHAHEGYLEQGLMVRDARKLRANYLATRRWRLDLLSLLPTDLAYAWWSQAECRARVPCPVIVRINRLLRLPRMWEWFDRTETATGYPNAFRICKVVLAILVLIHWNACFYFAISYAVGFGTDNWVYNLNGPRNASLSRQYIYSFYWSTLTLTTIGETPTPENDIEYIFVVCDFLAGVLIFATIVGNIGSMISNMNVARVEFQNRMDGVKQYMAFRKVSGELEDRVIKWFAYTWAQSGALDEERVLAALPDKLKAEIAIRVHMETLRQVRIFQDCEPGLLEALVLKLRLQVFSPGDYICRKGDVGKEMYIVKRGRLLVVGDDGHSILATISDGSVFGEVSVLDIPGNRTGNRRTANVRSLGYSDLFCLAKRDLWEAMADYPEARTSLTERGCQLLRKDGLLDEDAFEGAQRAQDTFDGGLTKLENAIEALETRFARLLAEFAASQAKMKQRVTRLETKTVPADKDVPSVAIAPHRTRLRSLQARKRSRTTSSDITNKQNTF